MDPFAYNTRLIDLAYEMATKGAKDEADVLRRFRTIYRHLSTSAHSVMVELGQGPFGPMPSGMGMQMPDVGKLLSETDRELSSL